MQDVNSERDAHGVLYARKAMIHCGLLLDVDGIWRIEQLFPHLQEIIHEHRHNFDGEHVPEVLLREE